MFAISFFKRFLIVVSLVFTQQTLFCASLSMAVKPSFITGEDSDNSSKSSFISATTARLDSYDSGDDEESSEGRMSPRRLSGASGVSLYSAESVRGEEEAKSYSEVTTHTRKISLRPKASKRDALVMTKKTVPGLVYTFEMSAAGLKNPIACSVDLASFSTIKELYAHLSELCAEWFNNPASHFFPKKFSRWQKDVLAQMANPLSIAVFYLVNNKRFSRLESFRSVKELTTLLGSSSPGSPVQMFVNYAWGDFGIPLRLRLENDPATEIKVTLQEECFNSHAHLLNEIARLSKIWGWRKSGDDVHVIDCSIVSGAAKKRISTNILKYSQKELQEKASVLWESPESYWNVIVEPHLLED